MGVGPAVAIPAAVKSAGLQLDDIDLFEINEVVALVLSLINFFNFINATGPFKSCKSLVAPCRHLHPSLYIAVTSWVSIQKRSMLMEVHLPLGILWAQQVIVVLIVYDFKITHISCCFRLSYFWQ